MKSLHFQAQNGPFALNVTFFRKTINIIIMYLLAFFIMQNFKKILEWIQSDDDVPFLGQNGPFAHNENFLEKALNNFHVFLFYLFILCSKLNICICLWNSPQPERTQNIPKTLWMISESLVARPIHALCPRSKQTQKCTYIDVNTEMWIKEYNSK